VLGPQRQRRRDFGLVAVSVIDRLDTAAVMTYDPLGHVGANAEPP